MRKASLFSGIGGIDLAAHWAGMQTVVFCEREPFPQRVLRKHWPDVPIIDDVHDFTREELERRGIIGPDRAIDLISAGYPCQPFSHAGKRGGSEDDRHLWPEVKRILEEIRPRWFVGENVAGHITLGLDEVLADLEDLEYTAQAFVVPASSVYASHQRKRVFVVAYSPGERQRKTWRDKRGRFTKRPAGSGADVADTYEQHGDDGRHDSSGVCGERESSELSNSETLGDANISGRQERDASAVTDRSGYRAGGDNAGRTDGATEPRVGRSAHELSRCLDGGMNPLDALAEFIGAYPQPALMGQAQHEWEPPRVATGIKDRSPRLKALGNAVNPLQILPIMYAIKVIDDWMRTAIIDVR